jgi:hypothetical protein
MIRFLRITSFVVFALCNFLLVANANTDIPNHYQEPGLYPNRDYLNQHLDEFIDPFQGSLQLQHVDIALPGDSGFDLKVQRSYNLRSLNQASLPAVVLCLIHPSDWNGLFYDHTILARSLCARWWNYRVLPGRHQIRHAR